MTKNNNFRDGKVFICAKKCSTCIYRPGNLMHLNPGRKEDMEKAAVANGSVITCHKTLSGDNAVCRGFFDTQKHMGLLSVAERLGLIREVDPDAD